MNIRLLLKILLFIYLIFILDEEIKPFERRNGINIESKGELVEEKTSPNKQYIFRLYELNGNATVGFGRIGEVEYVEKKQRKIIYFNYPEDKNAVTWKSNNQINVNGITLDVETDVYNYKRHTYNFFKGY